MTTTRKVVAIVLVVALVAAAALTALGLLTGGSDPAEPDPAAATPSATASPTPEAGATEPPDPALAEFYSQEPTWEPCGDHECATLTVPLDYADPEGETIDLALLRVAAADPAARVGSLVVNPGGPGAPGTSYAAQAGAVFRQPLLDAYDVVGFDPRGTGESAPVDCLTDAELDDYVAEDPSPDTAAERDAYLGWVETIGEGCAERSGDLAAHVTTVEAARDMDVLRAALGEAELDYFGASYGTKLGATYADLFPERVGRFVLDGAIDPTLTTRELNLGQAEGFERALRAYAEDCVAQDCSLGGSVEEVIASITGVVEAVDAEPLPAQGDRVLDVGNAFYGIVAPLYARDYWFVLTQALEAAQRGNGAVLLQLSDLYTSRGGDGYTDNSAEAIYAINCLDDPSAIPASEVPSQVPAFEAASPTFGEVFAWSLTGCGGIEVEKTVEEPVIDAPGAAPIVVVGTTRDPATPYDWAVAMAEQLESGVLVSRDGDGHTGYNAGNECVDTAVDAYLVEGTVPEDGLSC